LQRQLKRYAFSIILMCFNFSSNKAKLILCEMIEQMKYDPIATFALSKTNESMIVWLKQKYELVDELGASTLHHRAVWTMVQFVRDKQCWGIELLFDKASVDDSIFYLSSYTSKYKLPQSDCYIWTSFYNESVHFFIFAE